MKDTMIGVDLAKNVFQLHGAAMTGEVRFRKKLSRPQFLKFMVEHPAAVIVMEACGGTSYWARELVKAGHEVKLIAPQYVKPFVKRQKTMLPMTRRSLWQRSAPRCALCRRRPKNSRRERLVHQRTELTNALRALLYEYGHAVPQGPVHLKRIAEIVGVETCDLPELAREEAHDLLEQIAEKTARIESRTRKIAALAALTPTARRLQTMPGVGPMTALAIEAFAPTMATFKCGRDFAAWLGLVPRQLSSGGKERLGRISKAGQSDIRRLLIIGAMSRLNWMGLKGVREGSWIDRLRARKPKMLVAIALANKMARMIWAMLMKQEDYRDRVPGAA